METFFPIESVLRGVVATPMTTAIWTTSQTTTTTRTTTTASSSFWRARNLAFLFAWFLALVERTVILLLLCWKETTTTTTTPWRRPDGFETTTTTTTKEEEEDNNNNAAVVVVFVTGWSSGIGFETCVLLLLSDFPKRKVEIHVPTRGFGGKGRKGGGFERESEDDETKTVERMRRVARERGAVLNETKKIVLAKIDVDLATLAVDARARKRTRRYFATERVDVLIHCAAECNAERKVVLVEEGGVDREAMCNVLGPAVLTKLWREEIAKDDKRKKKVVFVGSFTHRARLGVCTRANAREWVNRLDRCASERKEKDFETVGVRYALSKLMITAYALGKMRKEEEGVMVKVVDPGLCRTNLTRTWPKILRLVYEIPTRMVGLLEHPRKGAERILRAAALLEDENEGEKEEDWSNSAAYSALARDDAMQRLCVKAVDGFIASRDREG